MFSLRDGIYFGRLPNGRVRLLILPRPLDGGEFPKIDQPYPNAILDTAIDDGHWGSVVASVSEGGEANGRWYTAMDFHHGRELDVVKRERQRVFRACCEHEFRSKCTPNQWADFVERVFGYPQRPRTPTM